MLITSFIAHYFFHRCFQVFNFRASPTNFHMYVGPMFIHTRPSRYNDTTEDKKRKHSKQAAKSSNYQRPAVPPGQSSHLPTRGRLVSQSTPTPRQTARPNRRTATRRSDHSTKGQTIHGSQCAPPASPRHTVRQQHVARQLKAQIMSCYVMQPSL